MRKLMGYFIALTIMLAMQACSSPATPTAHIETVVQNAAAKTSPNNLAKTETNNLTGHYVYGPEADAFQPCNQTPTYWVTGPAKLLANMAARYNQLASEPYEKVFVSISGEYRPKATDGFAMDYDGQIQINKLMEMRKASADDCTR